MIPVLVHILETSPPPPETVTPGPIGFLAIFIVAVATVLLGLDMVRRIRRTTYREDIRRRLEEETAAREAGESHEDRRPE